jgi:hypothetical protein
MARKSTMNTGTYHLSSMSISEILDQLDLKIHKVGHQDYLTVDGDVIYYYNTHVKSRI